MCPWLSGRCAWMPTRMQDDSRDGGGRESPEHILEVEQYQELLSRNESFFESTSLPEAEVRGLNPLVATRVYLNSVSKALSIYQVKSGFSGNVSNPDPKP